MSLGRLNKGSNCEGKILAYKKNKLCLISIRIVTRSVLSEYKAHARDFDKLLGS